MSKFTPSSFSLVHWYKHHYIMGIEVKNRVVLLIFQFPSGSDRYKDMILQLVRTKVEESIQIVMPIFKREGKYLIDEKLDIQTENDNGSRKKLPDNVFLELNNILQADNGVCASNSVGVKGVSPPLFKRSKFNDNFIIFSNDIVLNATHEITISLKILFVDIKPKGPDYDWQSVIQKSHYNDAYGLMLSTGRADLNINEKVLSFYLNGCVRNGEPINRIDYIWNDLEENRWYSILCMYDGKEAVIYIDGIKCQSEAVWQF